MHRVATSVIRRSACTRKFHRRDRYCLICRLFPIGTEISFRTSFGKFFPSVFRLFGVANLLCLSRTGNYRRKLYCPFFIGREGNLSSYAIFSARKTRTDILSRFSLILDRCAQLRFSSGRRKTLRQRRSFMGNFLSQNGSNCFGFFYTSCGFG